MLEFDESQLNGRALVSLSIEGGDKLRSVDDAPLIFRDCFIHLDLDKRSFSLPSAEIWVRDNTLIDNLAWVINNDIANIKELIDFEKGLRFAVQRVRDLIML